MLLSSVASNAWTTRLLCILFQFENVTIQWPEGAFLHWRKRVPLGQTISSSLPSGTSAIKPVLVTMKAFSAACLLKE